MTTRPRVGKIKNIKIILKYKFYLIMNYTIPATTEEILALGDKSVNEDVIIAAIAGVIGIARKKGQSLEDVQQEVLQDDLILDVMQRRWLKDFIAKAWELF